MATKKKQVTLSDRDLQLATRLLQNGWIWQRKSARDRRPQKILLFSPSRNICVDLSKRGWVAVYRLDTDQVSQKKFRAATSQYVSYALSLERTVRTKKMRAAPKPSAPGAPRPAAAKPVVLRMSADPKVATVTDASMWLAAAMDRGAECPCCKQFVKIYKRSLNSSMARVLIVIDRYFRQRNAPTWVHVPTLLNNQRALGPALRGGDWAKMVHWKLIEEKSDEVREDGSKRVGFYRITKLGVRFAAGRVRVPRYVRLYNQKVMPYEADKETTITIRDALGERFDYAKLMSR